MDEEQPPFAIQKEAPIATSALPNRCGQAAVDQLRHRTTAAMAARNGNRSWRFSETEPNSEGTLSCPHAQVIQVAQHCRHAALHREEANNTVEATYTYTTYRMPLSLRFLGPLLGEMARSDGKIQNFTVYFSPNIPKKWTDFAEPCLAPFPECTFRVMNTGILVLVSYKETRRSATL